MAATRSNGVCFGYPVRGSGAVGRDEEVGAPLAMNAFSFTTIFGGTRMEVKKDDSGADEKNPR
jgi:hypothetical protein